MKVRRQCPLVLLVKVCGREGKEFVSGESRMIRTGEKGKS
jgi:hypothetical protein